MKKIMFNDKYGLTQAVLEGRKTMTRRRADVRWSAGDIHDNPVPKYKVGEVLAVAQRYSELSCDKRFYDNLCSMCERLPQYELKGWDNKMFVRADLMPHRIRITDIKVERLQDISDEDCLREGVQAVEVQRAPRGFLYYGGGNAVPEDKKADIKSGRIYIAGGFKTPQQAFAKLIDCVSGKGTWDENPYVFAYEFELVK